MRNLACRVRSPSSRFPNLRRPLILLVVGLLALSTKSATAAVIQWGPATDVSTGTGNSSDVVFGEVVEAFTAVFANSRDLGTAVTVNGVEFLPTTHLLDGVLTAIPSTTTFSSATDGGDPEYDLLLDTAEFGGGTNLNTLSVGDGDGNFVNNSPGLLTPGVTYQIQVWYVDDRQQFDSRVMQFGDGNGNTVDLNDQYSVGTFVADATTQNLTMRAQGFGNAHITAYAITTPIPEPSTIALCGLAMALLLRRRRDSRSPAGRPLPRLARPVSRRSSR